MNRNFKNMEQWQKEVATGHLKNINLKEETV